MQVVSMREVEEAMAILGKVRRLRDHRRKHDRKRKQATEASAQPDEPANGSGSQEYSEKDFIRKRLFRNPDDKVIGGVHRAWPPTSTYNRFGPAYCLCSSFCSVEESCSSSTWSCGLSYRKPAPPHNGSKCRVYAPPQKTYANTFPNRLKAAICLNRMVTAACKPQPSGAEYSFSSR